MEKLLGLGHEVVVLDNFSTGRIDNLSQCKTSKALEIVDVDVRDESNIHRHFSGVDWVFHLAALADIVPSIQHPLDYMRAGVDGTIAVLEAARLNGVRRLIYSASSSCYGVPLEVPTSENAPTNPQYPYALAKWLGEECVLHWGQVYGLGVLSLRLFNVYGPRARTAGSYGAVFGVFLAQKLAGKPFTVVGDGTQTRDFTYVSDVVNAFLYAAQSNLGGEVINVGSGKTESINRLATLLGSSDNLAYIPKRPGEPDCTFADISKIRRLLGWEPKMPFEDGVLAMLENIDYWKDAPVWDASSIDQATADWFRYLGDKSE